ncbi:MAG: NUDIX domain-containing protein [Chloroflexi bacterium]|nr:NUDIX domain-containing protein [Chloroflexota bacterium]
MPAEERTRLVCQHCGYIQYLNPKVVAATLPVIDGKVVLIRRGIEPRLGTWSYPAGYVELGETVEEAARRETSEEACLQVSLVRLLDVYTSPGGRVVVIAYLAQCPDGQPRPGSEALEVGLFAPEEVPWEELAFPTTVAALRDWVLSARPGADLARAEEAAARSQRLIFH